MYKKIDLKLKIIIFILNMKKLSYHEKQLIIDIKKNKRIKILKIFEVSEKKRSLLNLKIFNKILLKIVLYIEKKLLKKELNEFKLVNYNLKNLHIKKIFPIRTKYVDRLNYADTKIINKLKPHLILNFTDRIIKGKILNIAKYGMWGFHYSDTNFQRNGLGGFYEITEKKEFSGVTLQQYNESIDGGKIISVKHYKTLKYFTINHSNLLSKTSLIFQESIEKLLAKKLNIITAPKYTKELYAHPPSMVNIFRYIFITYFNR
jgi:hypothetical protein